MQDSSSPTQMKLPPKDDPVEREIARLRVSHRGHGQERKLKPQRAWIAVGLNLFPLMMGLGYLYINQGYKWLLTVFLQVFFVQYVFERLKIKSLVSPILFIIWVITIVDVLFQVRAHNEKIPNDPDCIICPKCGLEQWSGNHRCHRCGEELAPTPATMPSGQSEFDGVNQSEANGDGRSEIAGRTRD
jgi:hypothetical protein